jgi:regulator of protease activity HflC (stomatin/prohibitin superfamily)
MNRRIKLVGVGFGVIATVGVLLSSMEQVDAGTRGVFLRYGDPVGVAEPGLNFMNPLTTNMVIMPVRTKKTNGTTVTYTKDVQQAELKYSLTYHLNPDAVLRMYETKGLEWEKLLIPQVVEQAIKDVLGRSEAVKDAINRRDMITSQIKSMVMKNLARQDIIVDGFEIRDVSFSDNFEKAVEAKQVAVELAQKAKNDTVRIKEESEQRIIVAKAQAEAMETKTRALAGSPGLTQYEIAIRWDGKLPNTVVGGNGAIPMLPLK